MFGWNTHIAGCGYSCRQCEVVEQLDLSEIYDDYGELRGSPPYEPVMMVKVLTYAMAKGIHLSRKIERALHEDVGMRTD